MQGNRNNEVFLIENVGPCGPVVISPQPPWFLLRKCTLGSPCVWEQHPAGLLPVGAWHLPPCCISPPSFSGGPQPASKSGCTGQSAACPRRSQAVSGPWLSAEGKSRIHGCERQLPRYKLRGQASRGTFSLRISWVSIIYRTNQPSSSAWHSRSFLSLAWLLLTHMWHFVKPGNS